MKTVFARYSLYALGWPLRLALVLCLLLSGQGLQPGATSPSIAGVLTPVKSLAISQTILAESAASGDTSAQVRNGGYITYTIQITNISGFNVTQVRIVISSLPRAFQNTAHCLNATCTLSEESFPQINPLGEPYTLTVMNGLSYEVGTLAPNEQRQLAFRARVIGQQDGDEIRVLSSAEFNVATGRDSVAVEPKKVTVRSDVSGERQSASAPSPVWSPEEIGSAFSQDWADFDRDGDLDLALGVLNGTVVYINQQGRLKRYWGIDPVAGATRRVYGVRWADLDQDGYPELIESGNYSGAGGTITIFKWDSAAQQFLSRNTIPLQNPLPYTLGRIVVADMTSDGKLDIIANSTDVRDPNPIHIFSHTAVITSFEFDSQTWTTNGSNSLTPTIGLAATQWNGLTRLVFSDLYGFIKIITASNSLQVQPYVLPDSGGGSYLPYDFAWGDFDGDTLPDLAAAYPLQHQVRIYHNNSSNTNNTDNTVLSFGLSATLPLQGFFAPLALEWSDLTGDGRADLLLAAQPPQVYQYGLASKQFTRLTAFDFQEPQGQVWSIRAARTRPSEYLDVMTTNVYQPSWLYNTFQTRLASQRSLIGQGGSDSIALGDVTGDGWVDAVSTSGGTAFIYANASGAFGSNPPRPLTAGGVPNRVSLGDLDGLGRLDLVVAANDVVRTFYGRSFAQTFDFVQPGGVDRSVALGDADGNFVLDVAIGSASPGEPVLIYTNTLGSRAPQLAFTLTHTTGVRSMAFADFDGDFYADLAIIDTDGKAVRLYRHNPDQTFTLSFTWLTTGPAQSLGWADADGDGLPELALGIADAPLQVIGFDKAKGQWVERWRGQASDNPKITQVAWGDWNNDGLPELAVGFTNAPPQVFANLNSRPGLPLQLVPLWQAEDAGSNSVTGLAWGDINNDGFLDLGVSYSGAASGVYSNQSVNVAAPLTKQQLHIQRPGRTATGYLQSSSELLGSQSEPTITLSYTLSKAASVSDLKFEFRDTRHTGWRTATRVYSDTITGTFIWNARADGAAGSQTYFRVRALPTFSSGPEDRAHISAISPPFQTLGNTCVWPVYARITAPAVITQGVSLRFRGDMVERVGSSGMLTLTWNFGDNSAEVAEPQPTHIFTRTGLFTVTVTITPEACPSQRTAVARHAIRVIRASTASSQLAVSQPSAAEQGQALPSVGGVQGEWDNSTQTVLLKWQPQVEINVTSYLIYRLRAGAATRVAELPTSRTQWSWPAQCNDVFYVSLRSGQQESAPSTSSFYTPACPIRFSTRYSNSISTQSEDSESTESITNNHAHPSVLGMEPVPSSKDLSNPQFNWVRASFDNTEITATSEITCAQYMPLVTKFYSHKTAAELYATSPQRGSRSVPAQFEPSTCDAGVYPSVSAIDGLGLFLNPVASTDGSSVAFISNQNWGNKNADRNLEIFLTRACGQVTLTQVTSTTGNIFSGYNLAATTNQSSTRIAFASDRSQVQPCINCEPINNNFEIFVADLTDKTNESKVIRTVKMTQVTSTTLTNNRAPAISADGRYIAFVSDAYFDSHLCSNCESSKGISQVYRAELDESGVKGYVQISRGGDVTTLRDYPVISANGNTVAYLSNEKAEDAQSGRYRLYKADQNKCLGTIWYRQSITVTAQAPFAMNAEGTQLAFISEDERSVLQWPDHVNVTDAIAKPTSNTFYSQVSMNDSGDRVAYLSSVQVSGQVSSTTAMLYNAANLKFDSSADLLSVITPTKNVSGVLPLIGQARLLGNGRALALTTNTGVSVVDTADLLDITIAPTPTTAVAGSYLVQTFTVKNKGAFEAQNVVITGTAETTNTVESVTKIPISGECSISKPSFVCSSFDTLAARDVVTITYKRKLDGSQPNPLTILVSATTSSIDPDLTNNYMTFTFPVTYQVGLTLSVTSGAVIAGKAAFYTATITNTGPSNASNVNIKIGLPSGFYAACKDGTPSTEPLLICRLTDSLRGDGGNLSYTFVLTAPANQIAPLQITTTATSEYGNSSDVAVIAPVQTEADLSIGLSTNPLTATAGQTLTYTIAITNAGPSDAQNITTSLILTTGIPCENVLSTNITCVNSIVTLTPIKLSANPPTSMTQGIIITVPASVAAPVTATAFITSSTPDPVTNNNSFPVTVNVQTQANLQITASVTPSLVYTGQIISYIVSLSNTGPSDVQGLILTATLPITTGSLVSVSTPTSTQTITQLTWMGLSQPPLILTVSLTVPQSTSVGTLTATFTATAINANQIASYSVSAIVSQSVPITAVKILEPSNITSGVAATFTAAVLPTTATLPSYVWQSAGSPVTSSNWPIGPTVILTWTTEVTTTYPVTVTASSTYGFSVTKVISITVKPLQSRD